MTNKEAIRRIREHMIIHMLNEPQAIFITEALNLAITALEERTQGDLISRSALKEAINDNGCRHSHYFDIFDVIDNAPAVVIDEEIERQREELYQSSKKLFDTARMLGIERSQGEWIDHSEDYGYAECPYCHELTNCDGNIDELHYCWHCGSKLGKGGEE